MFELVPTSVPVGILVESDCLEWLIDLDNTDPIPTLILALCPLLYWSLPDVCMSRGSFPASKLLCRRWFRPSSLSLLCLSHLAPLPHVDCLPSAPSSQFRLGLRIHWLHLKSPSPGLHLGTSDPSASPWLYAPQHGRSSFRLCLGFLFPLASPWSIIALVPLRTCGSPAVTQPSGSAGLFPVLTSSSIVQTLPRSSNWWSYHSPINAL